MRKLSKASSEVSAIANAALTRQRTVDEEVAISPSLTVSGKGKDGTPKDGERKGGGINSEAARRWPGMAENRGSEADRKEQSIVVDVDFEGEREVADPQTSSNDQRIKNNHIESSSESSRNPNYDSFEFPVNTENKSPKAVATALPSSRRTRAKLPRLPDLALPPSPALNISEQSEALTKDEDNRESEAGSDDEGRVSSGHSSPASPSSLEDMLSWSTQTRPKARLQEPAAISPAVKEQITHTFSRRKSSVTFPASEDPSLPSSTCRRRSLTGTLSNLNSGSPGANKTTLFSVARGLKTSGNVAEEEQDPLEEDFIPEYKKFDKRQNKFYVFAEWFGMFLLSVLLICSVTIRRVKEVKWLGLNLWRWQALVFVVFSGRLISGWIVKLFVALIENQCLLKKRVLYFVYGLRRSVKNCIWLALVLGVWEVIFEGRAANKVVYIVTKVLWVCFTISLAWMVKVLAIKVAASSFHRAAYFDRIQDCLFNQFLLETLSAPPNMAKVYEDGGSKGAVAEETVTLTGKKRSHSHPSKATVQSATLTNNEMNKAAVKQLESVQGNSTSPLHPQKGKVRQFLHGAVWARHNSITDGKHELRAEPKQMKGSDNTPTSASPTSWMSGNRTTPRETSEAMPANESFEAAQQQCTPTQRPVSVSAGPLIALSSNPIEQDKLQQLTSKVLGVVLFIASLLILGVETSKLLVFFSSIFIPSVFVFGNAAKTTFEALIFLFIIHPFDVGDRISVDGQMMLVEEMNVLNTTFLSGSNEKVYYPNSVLANKAISNYYRSPDQWDGIEFQVHVSTSIEKLSALKERMQSYIESLPQFWYPDFGIICKDIEDSNKMKMGLWMQHHLNYQEAGERYRRRSNMLLYMKQQLEDLGIGYQLPHQEVTVKGVPVHVLSNSKQWLL